MVSRLKQSFSFHQSPEAFISSRLQQFALSSAEQDADHGAKPIIRAEILNRNVHLVSSYRLCKAILCASEHVDDNNGTQRALIIAEKDGDCKGRKASTIPSGTFATGPAYEQLMVAFFPLPDILLEDGELHRKHKRLWSTSFLDMVETATPLIHDIALKALIEPWKKFPAGVPLDLYETLKALSWDILFAVFLGLEREGTGNEFRDVENMQESVLRGQFSLFPVPIRTPLWTSPRSHGLRAVHELGSVLTTQLRSQWDESVKSTATTCPFAHHVQPAKGADDEALSEEVIVSHVRLFTSSLANKALASLLTAFLMNLFLWRDPNLQGQSLATLIAQQGDSSTKRAQLSSVLMETMRLSPPVIGVMRRVTQSVCVCDRTTDTQSANSYRIPAGHDVWLYFAAANRDPDVFAHPAEFRWDRFMQQGAEPSADEDSCITFGLGVKRCLGMNLTRRICLTVAETVIESGLAMNGSGVVEEGVKAWLGWAGEAGPQAMARDLKQLPCQRPRRPVMVTVCSQV